MFYIDRANNVREKISDNNGTTWRDGLLGNLNLLAMDDPEVALQACYGSFYDESKNPSPGIHLWYAVDSQTLQAVDWIINSTAWTRGESYTANGHAGVGCYSWGPGSVWYAMMVNLQNDVNVLWRDASNGQAGTWSNTSVVIPDVLPTTSLGYTDCFFAQLTNGSLAGYNISFSGANTQLVPGGQFTIPQKPVIGTHFAVTVPSTEGGDLVVFSQDTGTDITENVRDSSGQWTSNPLPVPKS
jgi:hypothetical protein